MIIAVDIGNSAIKAALVEPAGLSGVVRLDGATASEADLRATLEDLVDEAARAGGGVPAVLAVNVVDRWSDRLARASEASGLQLTVVSPGSVPIRTALVRPEQTGPDRLLAMWAAWRLHGAPLVVVGLGTATTVDALDAEGSFLGGAIMPGLGLATEALAEGTARLPRVELAPPTDVIGRDTLAAIRSGVVIGQVGAIRELVTRMRLELGAGTRTVLSGGHAGSTWVSRALLEPAGPGLPGVADVVEPELVLRGIGLLAEHGRTGPASVRPAAGAMP